MVKIKAFFQKWSIETVYPNGKNMFILPNHKYYFDYHENLGYPICWKNIDLEEYYGNKSFSSKSKASKLCISMTRMCLLCTITIRMEIMLGIQVCLFWWMNFDFMENNGKKKFSCKKQSIKTVSPNGKNMVIMPNHKKNGDYDGNASLSLLMDELWF